MPPVPGVERVSMRQSSTIPKIVYETIPIKDIVCNGSYDKNGRFHTDKLLIKGARVNPTQRFWTSVCSLYGIGPSMFKWFTPEESFNRIAEKSKDDRVKLALEMNGDEDQLGNSGVPINQALAVSNPNKVIVHDDQAKNVFTLLKTKDLAYGEGKVFARIGLRRDIQFDVGGDIHDGYVTCECPIDGYGKPQLFVSLLRQICTNGMVGYAKAFKTEMILGDDPQHTMRRNIEAYNNEDGFVTLKDRLISSQKSAASVFESATLGKAIWKLRDSDFSESFCKLPGNGDNTPHFLRNRLLETLSKKTGDLRSIYGVAQIDSISEKRMKQLPTKATVYDLLCLATEVAQHQINALPGRNILSWAGAAVGAEFDLENSTSEFKDFDAFVDVESKKAMDANKASSN